MWNRTKFFCEINVLEKLGRVLIKFVRQDQLSYHSSVPAVLEMLWEQWEEEEVLDDSVSILGTKGQICCGS
jgi:hypothetical protein